MNSKVNNRLKNEPKITELEKARLSLVILSVALLSFGRAVEITTTVMAIFGLVLLINKKTRLEAWDKAVQMYALLFMFYWLPMVISLIGAVNFSKTLSHDVEYLRFFFAGVFVLFTLREEKIRDIVVTALVVIVGFWLVDSLIQRVHGVDMFGHILIPGRLSGPFRRLHMPIYLTLLLPMVLAYLWINFKKYIFWPFFVLSLLALFWAGSRASWIALIWGAFLYGLYVFNYAPKKPYLLVVLMLVSSGAVMMIAYQFDAPFKERLDMALLAFDGSYDSINKASSTRLPIWEAGARIFLENPVNGIGAKGFRFVYHDFANKEDPFKGELMAHPHLFILEILVETGVIGFIAMIGAIVFMIKTSIRCLPTANLVQVAAIITLGIAFFPLNTHTSFYGGDYSQLAWLITAIAFSYIFNAPVLPRKGLV